MPFKSEAQRRKFASLVSQGKMSKDTFDEWNDETKEKLPEKSVKKKKPKFTSIDQVKDYRKKEYGV